MPAAFGLEKSLMRVLICWFCLSLLSVAVLGGCTGGSMENASLLNQPAGKGTARVKITRTGELVAALRDARIKLDGKQVAALSNGNSIVLDIPVGSHEITSDVWDSPGISKVRFDARPATLYTFEVTSNIAGTGVGAFGAAGAIIETAGSQGGGLFLIRLASEKRIEGQS
jgi:hypothetical protein